MRILDCPSCKDRPVVEVAGVCRYCGKENKARVSKGHMGFLVLPCEHCGVGIKSKIPGRKKRLKADQHGIIWDSKGVFSA